MSSTTDFLVSFKESDRPWAELISQVLREVGYQTELVSWAYKASRDMLAEVELKGLDGAVFLPVLTPAYMTTLHAEHYWFEAFREGLFPVLPVQARECDIHSLLFIHSYVDIRDCTVDEARARVLADAYRLKPVPTGGQVRHAPVQSSVALGARMADLPPVRRVPFERAEPFIGGKILLEGVHAALKSDGIAALLPHESGMNGFGRRKTCIEYLYRYEQEYKLIWVLRANHCAAMAEDYARLAEVIGLPEAACRDLPYTVQAVRRWLSANPGWLLLFYNPPSHAAIAPCLPEAGRGHVLISAEKVGWPQVKACFHVRRWNAAEAQSCIATLVGEAPGLERLGQQLHAYPLASSLAVALARAKGWDADALAARFEARADELAPLIGHKNAEQAALATALSLALSTLWGEAPESVELLRALAYLDPYNILPGVLVSGAGALPGEVGKILSDHTRIEATVQLLRAHGLLEERFGSITLHPLVQSQFREWMESSARGALQAVHPQFSEAKSFSLARAEGPLWAKRMLRLMLTIFPEHEQFDRKARQASKVVPHLYAVLGHAARLGIERAECVDLWTRLGEYLLYRELLEPAAEALEQAHALDNQPHLGGSGQRYRLLRALGQVRSYQGQTQEARQHLEQARNAAERAHGRKSPEVSEVLILLGNARRKAEDHKAALEAYEEALDIDRELHAGPHADVVRDLMLVGAARQETGDVTTAWSTLEQALGMQGVVHGPDHISLAQVSRCMARVYRAMGDLPQAQHFLQQAIAITTAIHGPGHPALAEVYADYGEVLFALRDIDASRRAFKDAFKILEAVYGQHDLRLVECALRLGDTALARGDVAKAVPAYERAAAIVNAGDAKSAAAQRVQQRLANARAAMQSVAAR
jgi:tetratricopeptide (TPR) repeat protein